MGQQVTGKGYENTSHYRNCNITFLDIENIHKVRDSFKKMIEISQSIDKSKWLKNIDDAGWFNFQSNLLSGAEKIYYSLKQGKDVVIHCSHGWDRTSQLCSLVQIYMDPYFRTFEGFATLI